MFKVALVGQRKRMLRSVVPEQSASVLYADHIDGRGVEFFRRVCGQDLEGVVAKLARGAYGERWHKIRNPSYSQNEGRRELFDRRRSVGGISSDFVPPAVQILATH